MNLDLRNRQHLLLLIAGLVVAYYVGDRVLLTPLLESWKSRSARIAAFRRDIAHGRETLRRESVVRSRWAQMQTNALPGGISSAEGAVLKAFDRWSGESRISVTSVKPQWKHPADDYMTLECRVDAFGNLSSLTRFLYEVEKDALGVRLESLELSTKESDGSQLTLSLQVNGLYLNPPEP
jgi:hypothetical protein